MPGIRTQNVRRGAGFAKRELVVPIITAISQTGKPCYSFIIGHAGQIVKVSTFNSAKAGAVSGTLKVGGRVAAPLVFTAATEVAGVLSATDANILFSATDAITIEYTSDGSGALTNGVVTVQIRMRPMNGDLGPAVLRV